jgi:CheY-like chemotaxis protein
MTTPPAGCCSTPWPPSSATNALIANDGSSAWELLCSQGIDVLLTDWLMPGVDGPQLCRRVREELNGHYVYIVLITGAAIPSTSSKV